MKFTRLRILGFKTFVEPTEFLIEPGLTGVVGPNGCGKSNLVEALRWVMGESSFKNMRASGMDDVIFSGSGNRPARNTAEVMLTVDNGQRLAPAQFNDHDILEVSRRIEREAGSVYRINGREVRARDVQLLFADASTGARSPALVRQGQIGEIISAKPQARRRILEEAAGIAGLHARRHEAETRLKGAETNLDRLETVLAQIEQQLESLKRQARQAVRYRGLSADIRKAEATLAFLKVREAGEAVREAERLVELETRIVAQRTTEQAEAAKNQAVAAHRLPALREDAARAGAALQRLIVARDQLDGEERRARERLAELERRVAQLDSDIAREKALGADADGVLARLAAESADLAAATETARTAEAAAAGQVTAAEAALVASERAFGEATSALAEIVARRNQLERSVRDTSERLVRLEGQLAEIDAETARLEQGSDHAARLEALKAGLQEAAQVLADAETEAVAAEQAHAVARSQEGDARRPLADAERTVQRLETEVRTLSKLLNVGSSSMWPPVLEAVRVAKGYETALGAALGDDLDAPTDSASPQRWAGADGTGDPGLPEGVGSLAAHVKAPDQLARRLAQIGVVSRADGARLASLLKPGQRLVSREGDLWRWDGFVVAANAPTAAARRLAERNRLGDIEQDLVGARAKAAELKTLAEAATALVKTAATREQTARDGWRSAQRAADGLRDQLAAAERAAGAVTTRLAALVEARVRLNSSLDEARAVKADALLALEGLGSTAGREADLAGIRARVAQDRATLAEARAEAQGLAREAELRSRRLAEIGREREAWLGRQANAGRQIADLDQRLAETRAEAVALAEAPDTFVVRRRELIALIQEAEARQRGAADALAGGETAQAETDRAARAALDAMTVAREAFVRTEARLEAARQRIAEIAGEVVEKFEVEPAGLARIAGIAPDDELPALRLVEDRLEAQRREREKLGGVNLRADEELTEVQAQFDGMVSERDDLVEAIRKLRSGIGSLNREGRERLLASFATVNDNFQRLFTTLFGGGTAELQLVESDDPLEAGLDILAKPPGKKPTTLSLLSGGEQALTAIALIFAVFLTNPAPICVLDEVDAPLDDANVERYCDLLHDMTRTTRTRFIVITHNPITMSRMDRLFGVTMAERGVSTLVSVDLGRAEQLIAAE
ncbi:chromosome segregation protein SMC [Phreatobacter sp.]|uniref:chromosome segregation protein SMC n=1 Tax=Phreatobacter sp. TaxID=1966341 RepID=UPI003F6E4EC2